MPTFFHVNIRHIMCLLAVIFTHSLLADELTAGSECNECHSADQMEKKHAFEIVDSCALCHKNDKDHQLEDGQNNSSSAEKKIRTANSGLVYGLYYDKSRLGNQPNEMVKIPAGEFIMGSDNRLPDEGPQHTRNLDQFYIDIYEVTNLQFKAFIDDTERRSPKHFRNRIFPEGKADHPVTYVSWKDANRYCTWVGKRLPTDAEWEKAARGVNGRIFPWGDAFDIDKANTPQRWKIINVDGDTTPVGSFVEGASSYGVYDMSGNVWEWTDSWYQPYPGNTHHTENYGKKYKTLKGGSWWDCSFYQCGVSAPAYNRSFFLRSTKNSSFGFRCASDTPLLPKMDVKHAKVTNRLN